MSQPDAPTFGRLEVWVKVHQGMAAGLEFRVTTYPVVIGRGAGSDLQIEDNPDRPTMSRQHARLMLQNGRIVLQDISSNGTWVNARQLQRDEIVPLSGGEPIWIGTETMLTVELKENASVPVATSHPMAAERHPAQTPQRPTVKIRDAGHAVLSVVTLGRFEVAVDGVPLPSEAWSSRRAVLLLVYLAHYAPHPVPLEKLQEELWPEDGGSRAALQTAVSRLRQVLKQAPGDVQDPIKFAHNQYAMAEAFTVHYDVHAFESGVKEARRWCKEGRLAEAAQAFEAALATYGGPFMPGANENWVLRCRVSLEQSHGVAAVTLGRLQERQGHSARALESYRSILARDASREAAHEGLIRCLAALGRRDDALRQYQASAVEIKKLLGVSPGPDMVMLRELLVAGSPVPVPSLDWADAQ